MVLDGAHGREPALAALAEGIPREAKVTFRRADTGDE